METLLVGNGVWGFYNSGVFLRCNQRTKDGKTHRYWSVVENRRLSGGRVVQRQVLYLGEINDSQREAWRKTIEVFDEGTRRQVALFAEGSMPVGDADVVGIRLNELQLKRPRQWGACWLSIVLWEQLKLDEFWSVRLLPSREGTAWVQVLQTLAAVKSLIAAVTELAFVALVALKVRFEIRARQVVQNHDILPVSTTMTR